MVALAAAAGVARKAPSVTLGLKIFVFPAAPDLFIVHPCEQKP